jgi:fatty acid desaturase
MTAAAAASPRRIAAHELVTPVQLAELRERVEWKGIALIAHAWAVILGSIALVALFPNPLTFVLAVMLIGSRQLGLAILMHEGAHRCFSRDETRNMALSQWLCAYPIFADTRAYRHYHLAHHAHTQQDDDPDLVLSAPFPVTKASYFRKLWRDITGQTGYQQHKAQFLNAMGDPAWPLKRCLRHIWDKLGPQMAVNAAMFLGCALAGVWWAYPLLWLVPLLTWMMVITRCATRARPGRTSSSASSSRPTSSTTTWSTTFCSMCPATTCPSCTRYS